MVKQYSVAKAGGPHVQGQPGILSGALTQKRKEGVELRKEGKSTVTNPFIL